MAFQTIGTFKNVYEWEQPEIIDQSTSTGDTVEIVQEYARVTADVIVKQETFPSENRSNFLAELWLNVTAGENGSGFTFNIYQGRHRFCHLLIPYNSTSTMVYCTKESFGAYPPAYEVAPGETKSVKVFTLDLSNIMGYDTDSNYNWENIKFNIRHKLDGSFPPYIYDVVPLSFNGGIRIELNDILIKDNDAKTVYLEDYFSDIKPIPLSIDRGVTPLTADNFSDEGNPSFSYNAPTGASSHYIYNNYPYVGADTVVSFQAALSFDGETADIDYRDIPLGGTNYTFELTEAERELLRVKAQGSDNVPIYYLTKVIRNLNTGFINDSKTFITPTKRVFTVVGCNPTLNPTVKDIKPETLALTGDENTFVRYESMAEFAINATASKHATIVSQSVTCGSKTISNLPYGVIDDVESSTFIFNITDSRGMGASSSVFKKLIEYVKPTCYQKAEIEITGETGATIKLTVNGNYFNGSFGAADNTLQLEVRHTDGNGNWGEWTAFATTPTFNGITYELETTFTGFDYGKGYVFQSRITDKLNVVESSQYTVRMLPVFDWSEEDFNFNVPVNIDAEDLNMHGKTIIRHSDTTNNTVLSASNGNIYIRPGGTDNTYNETIFYGNGNVEFDGGATFGGTVDFNNTVNFNYSFTVGGYLLNDYVIETGSEAMGSNGTWYWAKWLSGKAEAWGCRNFGNMAVSTAWGNLYRSAVFTQDLPDNVFIRTPDAININFVHSGGAGWISKHEQTAPSAVTTGSFVVVRPVSGNITPTNIGFHIIGEWY